MGPSTDGPSAVSIDGSRSTPQQGSAITGEPESGKHLAASQDLWGWSASYANAVAWSVATSAPHLK